MASLDQVKITREAGSAVIEYAEPKVWTTSLTLGPEVNDLTDQQILDRHNEILLAQEQLAAEYEHVAIEIPPGRPQIEFHERSQQWTPRGDVLRCTVHDGGPENEAVIDIDDQELSLAAFGRMLTTHAGWGMRITFVPEDELHEEPAIEVREPERKGR